MKTIVIPVDQIDMSKTFPLVGEPDFSKVDKPYWEQITLKVNGVRNYAGFSIGLIPEGHKHRKEQGGDLIPGPWAYAFSNPGVLDNHGGTRAELEVAQVKGLLYTAELGDRLDLDGTLFEIKSDHNDNIKLVKVEA